MFYFVYVNSILFFFYCLIYPRIARINTDYLILILKLQPNAGFKPALGFLLLKIY
jgi:hypothetical protein